VEGEGDLLGLVLAVILTSYKEDGSASARIPVADEAKVGKAGN
jgi:hypothetical protein